MGDILNRIDGGQSDVAAGRADLRARLRNTGIGFVVFCAIFPLVRQGYAVTDGWDLMVYRIAAGFWVVGVSPYADIGYLPYVYPPTGNFLLWLLVRVPHFDDAYLAACFAAAFALPLLFSRDALVLAGTYAALLLLADDNVLWIARTGNVAPILWLWCIAASGAYLAGFVSRWTLAALLLPAVFVKPTYLVFAAAVLAREGPIHFAAFIGAVAAAIAAYAAFAWPEFVDYAAAMAGGGEGLEIGASAIGILCRLGFGAGVGLAVHLALTLPLVAALLIGRWQGTAEDLALLVATCVLVQPRPLMYDLLVAVPALTLCIAAPANWRWLVGALLLCLAVWTTPITIDPDIDLRWWGPMYLILALSLWRRFGKDFSLSLASLNRRSRLG